MGRQSFRDAVTGVLKAHGYVTANDPGDIAQDESDSFNLVPGFWQWNGSAWVAFTPPPPTPNPHIVTLQARLDAIVSNAALPQAIKDFAAALRVIYS